MYGDVEFYILVVRFIVVIIICAEYQQCPSPGGPLTGEWVLTDVADNTQLGTRERIRDKMEKLSQATPTSAAKVGGAIDGGMSQESERAGVEEAERRAREAEREKEIAEARRQEVEREKELSETRRQEAEREKEIAETRRQEAEREKRAAMARQQELEEEARVCRDRAAQSERRLALIEQRSREREEQLQRLESQWERFKEDIGTADVTMNERVWLHQVEVVEGSGHIQTYGDG